jgi:hypothetical protein
VTTQPPSVRARLDLPRSLVAKTVCNRDMTVQEVRCDLSHWHLPVLLQTRGYAKHSDSCSSRAICVCSMKVLTKHVAACTSTPCLLAVLQLRRCAGPRLPADPVQVLEPSPGGAECHDGQEPLVM